MAKCRAALAVLACMAIAGCAALAALVPPANNTADTAASYVVQVCSLKESDRAAAIEAMNATIAPRRIEVQCP